MAGKWMGDGRAGGTHEGCGQTTGSKTFPWALIPHDMRSSIIQKCGSVHIHMDILFRLTQALIVGVCLTSPFVFVLGLALRGCV